MDKRNTLLGLFFLLAAFTVLTFFSRPDPRPPAPRPDPAVPAEPATVPAPGERPAVAPPPAPASPLTTFAGVEDLIREDEEIIILRNAYVEVRLTNFGGAVKEVELLGFEDTKGSEERFVFNSIRFAPIMGLPGFAGADPTTPYAVVERSENRVVFEVRVSDQIALRRIFELTNGDEGDPYLLRHRTILQNSTAQDIFSPRLLFNVGTAAPVSATDRGFYLNFGYFDGRKARFIGRSAFESGFLGWLGMRPQAPTPVVERTQSTVWASVKNQFFTSVVTPASPAGQVQTRRVEFPIFEGETTPRIGITGALVFDPVLLRAGEETVMDFDVYVGPKEYSRLSRFAERQDLVMQFGFFGFFSKLLLTLMTAIYQLVPNYGVSIIITTFIVKLLLFPLTAHSVRSSRKMARISEPMKEIREKYKDDPRKQQEETLKLFKTHKINPLSGCLPVLIQLPIFFGLFRMLQSASELRFAEFLWITDLSSPDTVAELFGIPLRILPFLMTASMYYQMKMMPTPTTDNFQAKIFRYMPFIFFFFAYTFSSGLVLYWTVQNIFTIGQQWLMYRNEDNTPLTATVGDTPAKKAKSSPGVGTPGRTAAKGKRRPKRQ